MKPLKLGMSPTRNRRLNEVLGLTMVVSAGLLLLALASYTPSDPSLNTIGGYTAGRQAHNWTGVLGAWISDLLLQVIGIAAFVLPLMMLRLGLCWMWSRAAGSALAKNLGLAVGIAFAPAMFALLPGHLRWRGALPIEGVLGRLVADSLIALLNFPGACIVIGLMVAVALYLSSTFTFNTSRQWFALRFAFLDNLRDRWNARRHSRNSRAAEKVVAEYESRRELEMEQAQKVEAKAQRRAERRDTSLLSSLFGWWGRRKNVDTDADEDDLQKGGNASMWSQMPRTVIGEEAPKDDGLPHLSPEMEAEAAARLQREMAQSSADNTAAQAGRDRFAGWLDDAPAREPEEQAFSWMTEEPAAQTKSTVVPFPSTTVPAKQMPSAAAMATRTAQTSAADENISFGRRADESLKTITLTAKSVHGFKLPPSNLLYRNEEHTSVREEELLEEARTLVEKCAEFDVNGQVVQINPGPVVTTFEFRPDAGVKYSRVTGLADDLCLAMAAESILIERMAGKSTVGIQVPNSERETIWLRDIVESEHFATSKSRLAIAMGKDINGRIVTADLASMPHVLIAGSTGSGKSVAINAMIMSVLFKATPEQVRMILVDPKRVELGMYEGIPHLFTPIITEPKLAANALRNAVREMERRLKLLASKHVRNLDQYNKLFESGQLFNEDGEEQEPLPYIMIIIDELADLMMLDKANVEES